jgi:hypothetical protein
MRLRKIPLNGRSGVVAYATVDASDYDELSEYSWHRTTTGYAQRSCPDGRMLKMHRQLLGLSRGDGKIVDHINHDRLDNRRGNLRLATRSINQANRLSNKTSTSRFLGVSWDATRQKWTASAWDSDRAKRINLGRFATEAAAVEAARAWRELHAPFVTYAA